MQAAKISSIADPAAMSSHKHLRIALVLSKPYSILSPPMTVGILNDRKF